MQEDGPKRKARYLNDLKTQRLELSGPRQLECQRGNYTERETDSKRGSGDVQLAPVNA